MTTTVRPLPFPSNTCGLRGRAHLSTCGRSGRRPHPAAGVTVARVARGGSGLEVRPAERVVLLDGRPVDLTRREFDVLAYLAARPRQVVTREELLTQVWGSQIDWQDPATVTEHIRRLRRKLEPGHETTEWVTTVRGVGYRFSPA